ncbi:MAG: class I SAM-dependent methyltransferase [bacterium]|nr:class I SAM-dependent methyltransferase [bacterium]
MRKTTSSAATMPSSPSGLRTASWRAGNAMGSREQPPPELHWWARGRREVFSAVLARYLRPGDAQRVLDVGCGSGLNLPVLRPFGSVAAVDLSRTRLQFARGYNPGLLCQADIHRLPFASNSFDLVTALDVIEHSEVPTSILAEMRRVCAAGGKALVSVPAFQFLWGEHDFIAGHVKRYTSRELGREMNSAGFRILKMSYFNFFLFPPFAVFRWTKWRRLRRRFHRWNAAQPKREPRAAAISLMRRGYEANVHFKALVTEASAPDVGQAGSENRRRESPPRGRPGVLREIVRSRPAFVGQMSSDFGWISSGRWNRLLGAIFCSESLLLPFFSLPFGASILAVGEKER